MIHYEKINNITWAPGVKAKAIAEIKEQFVSKNGKIRLVYDRNSYYEVFIQKNGKGEYMNIKSISIVKPAGGTVDFVLEPNSIPFQ